MDAASGIGEMTLWSLQYYGLDEAGRCNDTNRTAGVFNETGSVVMYRQLNNETDIEALLGDAFTFDVRLNEELGRRTVVFFTQVFT